MAVRKRWFLGLVSGFFFGLFLGLTLLGFGVFELDSPALAILSVAGLVVGLAGALAAPLRPRTRAASAPTETPPTEMPPDAPSTPATT
jgi:hypothetical protein